jgi:predicted nuclease with TOPRIM domain
MLASVLNSPKAIKVSVQIIRVFIKLSELLSTHKNLRKKIEEMIAENELLRQDLHALKLQNETLMDQIHDMRVSYEQSLQSGNSKL